VGEWVGWNFASVRMPGHLGAGAWGAGACDHLNDAHVDRGPRDHEDGKGESRCSSGCEVTIE